MRLPTILLLAGLLLVTGCGSLFTEPDVATKVLVEQGYTEIQITGYKYFICGHDSFSTGFIAVNPTGHTVSGAVCADWVSGSIIRLDDPK